MQGAWHMRSNEAMKWNDNGDDGERRKNAVSDEHRGPNNGETQMPPLCYERGSEIGIMCHKYKKAMCTSSLPHGAPAHHEAIINKPIKISIMWSAQNGGIGGRVWHYIKSKPIAENKCSVDAINNQNSKHV